jgi:ribosomal protein S18 acetylase RimI-like enzyme
MEVIRGSPVHFDACLSIARSLPRYFTEKGVESIGNDLRNGELYVASIGPEVVGFVTFCRNSQWVAKLSWIAVRADHHRRGIGTVLVEHMASELRSRDVRLLQVDTLSSDAEYEPYAATRKFYEKVGFMLLRTVDPYPGWDPGSPCAIYVKIL